MKKLNLLKLNQLSKTEIEKREMNSLKGGVCGCICAGGTNCPCAYEGPQCTPRDDYWGGSSTDQNLTANNPDNSDDNADTTSAN